MRDVFTYVCLSVCVLLATKKMRSYSTQIPLALFCIPRSLTCLLYRTLHNIFHITMPETTYIKCRLTYLSGTEGY